MLILLVQTNWFNLLRPKQLRHLLPSLLSLTKKTGGIAGGTNDCVIMWGTLEPLV